MSEAAGPACRSGPGALGVARTIEISATGGPRFGGQQYSGNEILGDKEVMLTFDDGPHRAYTQPILAALDRHCAKATFFMVGQMALADPAMVREVANRGHTIATHTWSHNYQLRQVPPGRATHEIELGFSAVSKALGAPTAPFFRFPFLSDSRAALAHLASRDLATFSIDIDSLDYRAKGADGGDVVFRTVMNELATRGRGILLFHDIQPAAAAALPRILDALKARGFRIVHMVPSSKLQTLAQFDNAVGNEAKRRQLLATVQPLAPRTITWPLTPPSSPLAAPPGRALSLDAPPGAPAAAATFAPPPAAPVRRQPVEPDWRARILGNN
jgi:peptidoglycan/xylan/chitin deacetylase (PgdA/CDA1 family)